MSSPGPERVPSSVKVGKTSGQGKPPAAKSGGNRPAGSKSGGGKGRKTVAPVKVSGGRNWGPIAVAGVVVLIAVGIIGYGVFAATKSSKEASTPWADRVAKISGVIDWRTKYPDLNKTASHKSGPLTYPVSPPVGGTHNPVWQNCMGDIYTAAIPKENAVHSLEHGAVWVTYQPGLDAADIDTLKSKVEGKDYMLMSPYPGLDSKITLQAWGFQLKVDNASDGRIDDFIKAARINASKEPGAACSGGNTSTGDTPVDTPS